jgi:pectin methylesterase-like acyl-CoA thioesterase
VLDFHRALGKYPSVQRRRLLAHWRRLFFALAWFCVIASSAPNGARAGDYLVDPSGANGAFPTVQSAVDAVVGQTETDRANIFIAPARYVEMVTIDKPFVTLIGQGAAPTAVVISFNRTYVFNSPGETVTIGSSAIAFMARNLSFENSTPDRNIIQAIAVGSYADRAIFDNVRFLGYQDTLWVDARARQYFRGSFITGDTDFIFGDATALFDRCTIESTDGGWITAADTARITANGFIFLDCTLVKGTDRSPLDDGTTAPNNSVFLGRPWIWDAPNQMASVTYIRTRMGPQIAHAGWDPWNAMIDPHPSTRLSEWGSMDLAGQPLADINQDGTPDGRVSWADHLTEAQAANYTAQNIFGPVEFWDAATQPETSGIPYVSQGDPWNPNVQLLSLPSRPGVHPQLFNISTRLRVGTGDSVAIGGFIITGVAPKKVFLRAIGPSLYGLDDVLADPVLELRDAAGDLIAANDNWRDDAASASKLTTIGLAPADDAESALVITLLPGQYTAIVRGNNETTGTALVEAYDGDLAADSQLANISTRGLVSTNENVMIGGFIVGGNSPANGRVVVRAIGPSLSAFGIAGALPDPLLELKDANGSTLMSNDDWRESQEMEINQTGLAPADDRESALVTSLPNGNYTAIVSGKSNASGVAVVEVYGVL